MKLKYDSIVGSIDVISALKTQIEGQLGIDSRRSTFWNSEICQEMISKIIEDKIEFNTNEGPSGIVKEIGLDGVTEDHAKLLIECMLDRNFEGPWSILDRTWHCPSWCNAKRGLVCRVEIDSDDGIVVSVSPE